MVTSNGVLSHILVFSHLSVLLFPTARLGDGFTYTVAELCIMWPLSSSLDSISSPHKSHQKFFTRWDLRVTVFERMCLFSLYIEDCCIFF